MTSSDTVGFADLQFGLTNCNSIAFWENVQIQRNPRTTKRRHIYPYLTMS